MALAYKEFTPPPVPGLGRAVTLAFIAHAFLVIALSLGVQWRQTALEPASFQAELWSALPVEAAPPEPVLPPEVETPQALTKKPEVAPPAPPEAKSNADIVLAQKKAQREKDKEQDRLEKERKNKEEKLKADKRKEDSAKAEKLKASQRKENQAEKQKAEALAKAEEKKSAARLKEAKERALRLAGSAAGNGEPTATGNAAQSSGPGANYGGKIVAAIRPNITQSKEIAGNPSVEYDVYSDASGTILSVKLRKKSGDSYWDEVALNAIYKTNRLPRDDNGRVPSPITIALEPKAR
ncbi:MAG: cell envelope integrity protein TolA [Sulfuritalea sp.]|nr:cell envelope integrity protein TolA [Sulfuritalea sp.]